MIAFMLEMFSSATPARALDSAVRRGLTHALARKKLIRDLARLDPSDHDWLQVDNVVAVTRGFTLAVFGSITGRPVYYSNFEVSRAGNFKFAARVVQRICSRPVQPGTLASLSISGPCPFQDYVYISVLGFS